MKFSPQFLLNAQDWIKGAIMTAGGAVFAILEPCIEKWDFVTINWTNVWHTALGAGLVYLLKNFITPVPKTVTIDPEKTTVIEKPAQ